MSPKKLLKAAFTIVLCAVEIIEILAKERKA